MSTTLNIRTQFNALINDVTENFGGTAELTIDGVMVKEARSVATSTTITCIDTTGDDSAVDSFLYCAVMLVSGEANKVFVEFEIDKDNSVGDERITLPLPFDGAMLCIPGYQGYANYTTNFGGGTLDKIERIRLRNTSTGTTAVVAWFVVK